MLWYMLGFGTPTMRTYLRQCHAEFGTLEEEFVQLGVMIMG